MSVQYQAVGWNRQKKIYDAVVVVGALAMVLLFALITLLDNAYATVETALIRGLGLTAYLLLNLILCIGPLCRLWPRFLPLLYNRRHLGVTMCLLGLAHAGFALFQFHALGDLNPFVSLLVSNTAFRSLAGFPFEIPGAIALVVLLLMAATSHDFWLSVLTPPLWKSLHMLAYIAWALLVAHVALGAVQSDPSAVLLSIAAILAAGVIGLHLAAGLREWRLDRPAESAEEWVEVCDVEEIADRRARVALVGGERVAVFRYEGKLSCVSNVCRHQNGPLGEGKIIDGCITCPWHGYQYRPDTGTSPPPFNDKVETYHLRVVHGRVEVNSKANPPGTWVEPVPVRGPEPQWSLRGPGGPDAVSQPFYVGYEPAAAPAIARPVRLLVLTIAVFCAGVVGVLAWSQPEFPAATFEATASPVVGRVFTEPYPMLRGRDGRVYLLAGQGKHRAEVGSFNGEQVQVLGNLIRRGNGAMLEVAEISATHGGTGIGAPAQVDLGEFSLTGEIVDSKCWLGTMNPGQGKTHLACAVRCLSGGLTPLFAVRDSTGREEHLILTEANGGPMTRERLGAVGRRVTLRGRMLREGELHFFRVAAR